MTLKLLCLCSRKQHYSRVRTWNLHAFKNIIVTFESEFNIQNADLSLIAALSVSDIPR